MGAKKSLVILRVVLVALAALGIVVYWWARMNGDLSLVAAVQPSITILCIATALLSLSGKNPKPAQTVWITAGLSVALLGDFLNLDMGNPSVVIRGLIIFVVAYLTYAIGFTVINGFHRRDIYVGLVALAAYGGLMYYLSYYLGDMLIPGLVYGLVLPFLVTRAVSAFFGSKFSKTQAILLTIGTGMLYLGDIEFALHTYTKAVPMIFGPFLYAGGQLIISLCPSFGKQTIEEQSAA